MKLCQFHVFPYLVTWWMTPSGTISLMWKGLWLYIFNVSDSRLTVIISSLNSLPSWDLVAVITGWLPPVLDRIARNSSTVVCPDIDAISDETFEYRIGFPAVGGLNWNLQLCLPWLSWQFTLQSSLIFDKCIKLIDFCCCSTSVYDGDDKGLDRCVSFVCFLNM